MAFSETEQAHILQTLETHFWSKRRPPLDLRDKIREGQHIERQSIVLFFARPRFQRPDEWLDDEIVKLTYVRTKDRWKILWKRADLKWHGYEPHLFTRTLEEALEVVNEDPHGCFFG